MINVYAIHTPTYFNALTGKTVDADVIVVAGRTNCPVAPRAITPAEAQQALVGRFPALAGVEVSVEYGGTMRAMMTDIPCPELYL